MADTKIEWAEKVWNPVTGCSKISEGCQNCYAERMAKRLAGRYGYPKDEPFQVTLHPKRLGEPRKWQKPRQVFVCSIGDLFHQDISDEFIADVFRSIDICWHHNFLILTKRPQRMRKLLTISFYTDQVVKAYKPTWPLKNVWLGVSVENQKTADERIPILLQIPAKVRFVSIEPMLGPVSLHEFFSDPYYGEPPNGKVGGLDWVILGGETGPKARPMHPDWARLVRDQCQEAGVPFFFKQWGEWIEQPRDTAWQFRRWGPMVANLNAIPQPLDSSYVTMAMVGKKTAGRLLDGKIWEEWPK